MPSKPKPLAPRFWAKVEITAGCWNWTGAKNSTGYGWVGVGGRRTRAAHRVSWEMRHGPIPDGLHVLHHCDNRKCVNPAHLFLGTNTDNVADKVKKGRVHRAPQPGEKHPHAKLSNQDVLAMRQLAAEGVPHKKIAQQFGVYQQTASKIISGDGWSHIPGGLPKRSRKLSPEAIEHVLTSTDHAGVLGRLYGVSRTMICNLRRQGGYKDRVKFHEPEKADA